MATDDVYETTFDPATRASRSCCKGHMLIKGDRITISSPNQMYGGKTVILDCPVCRGERADTTPVRPRGPFVLTIPADLYDELPESTRAVLIEVAAKAQRRLLASKHTTRNKETTQ